MVLEPCPRMGKSEHLIPMVVSEALWPVLLSRHDFFAMTVQFNFKSRKIYLKEVTVLELLFSILHHI